LGVAAHAAEVITSAQAAAHYLADRLPAGAAVLVVGTTGLVQALTERGLRPVKRADEDVAREKSATAKRPVARRPRLTGGKKLIGGRT
jgi:ribonucleotide monophosphatase NagD (HAD superfamily)